MIRFRQLSCHKLQLVSLTILITINSLCFAQADGESVTIRLVGTQLTIAGTPGNDLVYVTSTTTEIRVQVNGAPPASFARAGVKSVYAVLGDGHDIFNANNLPIRCTAWGQNGNDLLVGGIFADVLNGGEGRDIIIGGPSADTLNGGTGEDLLIGQSLSMNDLTGIKQNWYSGQKNFTQRVNAIRALMPVTSVDLAVDSIDGGIDLEPDVFLGSFKSPRDADIKRNFNPIIDIEGLELMNILLIVADDLGKQIGCYGDRIATTPNLDAFASSGCRFTNGYVTQSNCSPSRSSILSGLYPHQNGQLGNVVEPLRLTGSIPYSMHPGIQTVPTMLNQAGYFTGIIGKLHVEPENTIEFEFQSRGSQKSRDIEQVLDSMDKFNASRGNRPFFLMVNNLDPHRPMLRDINGSPRVKVNPTQVPSGLPFSSDRTPFTLSNVADYYTCVNRLDEWFGRVHEYLVQNNLVDNTLIVFLSDNGPAFSRGKTSCFEAGLNVPFVVRWPGISQPRQVIDQYVSTIDLIPTFLTAARLRQRAELPGRSLRNLLLTGNDNQWRESYCAGFNSHDFAAYGPQRSIRKGQYKLILNLLTNPAVFPKGRLGERRLSRYLRRATGDYVQLFDLNADPYERTNIAIKRPSIVNELIAELQEWRVQTNDPLLNADSLRAETQWHIDNLPVLTATALP